MPEIAFQGALTSEDILVIFFVLIRNLIRRLILFILRHCPNRVNVLRDTRAEVREGCEISFDKVSDFEY